MVMEVLEIEKIVHGGFGLARAHGRVWLVPWTAPGDIVEASAVRQRGTYVEGQPVRVIKAGPGRIEPRCPVFGQCGGCHLQHLTQEVQIEARRSILLESLRRFAGIEGVEPQIISGNPWEYRCRLEFHVAAARIGFFARATHDLVPVDDCLIAASEIRALIPQLASVIAEAKVNGPANIEAVVGADQSVVIAGDGPPGWYPPVLPEALLRLTGVCGAMLHTRGRHWLSLGRHLVKWAIRASGCDFLVDLDPRSFCQANAALNSRLVEVVVSLAAPWAGSRILELYAGAGNFTLPLLAAAQRHSPAAHVTVVESHSPALESLRRAAKDFQGLLTCVVGRVESVLKRMHEARERFDVVIADPPRPGIGQAVKLVARLGALRIVLVSCEPTTLARDLVDLLQAGYQAQALYLVDMFPQTAHVEAVVLLSPK